MACKQLSDSAPLATSHKALNYGEKFAIAVMQPTIIKLMESEDAKEGVRFLLKGT